MGMGSEMVGLVTSGTSSSISAPRLLGPAASGFFLPKVRPKKPPFGRVADAADSRSAGKKAVALVDCLGREEHRSGVGGGGTLEVGTAGATRLGVGEVVTFSVMFSLVRVKTEPVQ